MAKKNGTACGDSGECLKGQCQPFCVKEGLKPCLCTGRKEDMCKRCCAPANATGSQLIDLCVPFKSERLRDNARCSLGYCNKVSSLLKFILFIRDGPSRTFECSRTIIEQ